MCIIFCNAVRPVYLLYTYYFIICSFLHTMLGYVFQIYLANTFIILDGSSVSGQLKHLIYGETEFRPVLAEYSDYAGE